MQQTILLPPHEIVAAPLQRTFLGWDRPALPAAAAALAEHYDGGEELRMDRAAVVLPGARAGRRLKALLADEAERRGVRLVPPRVLTVGALPELLYRAGRPAAGAALARRVWARALRGLPDEARARLSAAPPADAREWLRLARVVEALHQEVGGAGRRFAEVPECCAEGLLFADGARWEALADAQAAYEAELVRLGWADRDLARIDALAGEVRAERDLWLVGVVEMPGVARRLLDRLPPDAPPVRVLVHAPESEAAGFDAAGCLRPEAWSARPIPLRDEQVAVRGRPGEQADAAAAALAALDGRYAADQISVAVPDEELVPYLEQRLAAAGVSVHAASGEPVERTPVARLLAAVADYLDGARFECFAALVRHPGLARRLLRTLPDEGWVEALDAYFCDALPARVDGRLPGRAAAVEAVRAALHHDTLLGGLGGRRTLAEWMPALLAFVAEVYDGDPSPRLRDACDALRAAAAELHRLPPELDEPCDAAAALRHLLDEARGALLPPEPDRDAVELLGWLEMRLDDAPVAVVTGFNEPFLPESLNAHPFLPNALRERLGLVCNTRRLARDAYELSALLHSREHVAVVAGRRGAAGDPLRPSRLLFAVEGRAVAERVRRFYADTAPSAPAAGAPEPDARGFRLPAQTTLRAPEPIRRVPVTAFRRIMADPYVFALESVLRLETMDDGPREMDGLRFGSLAHQILEAFARGERVHDTDEAAARAALDTLLDDAVRARFGQRALPAVRIQAEQLRARLHRFAAWHAAWVADGWRVAGIECTTPEDGVALDTGAGEVHLTGRIDRIDHHPGRGEWALFDYKTGDRGASPEDTHRAGRGEARRWTDLQLPLYRHLLPHVADADGRRPWDAHPGGAVRLGYVALPRTLEETGARFAEWTGDELEEADECARGVGRLLLANRFEFDAARAGAQRGTPLAPLLGIGYLESAVGAEESDA
jgi:hypothetical protein